MRAKTSKWLGGLALVNLFALGLMQIEAVAAGVSEITRKSDGMYAVSDGKAEPMTEEVSLPNDIKVTTNGIFTVKGGKERELKLGQRLSADGMLISPDGQIQPVQDHLSMKRGKLVLVKDGESQPVTQTLTLPGGARVSPDGKVQTRAGTVRRILDGQLFTLDGEVIPAKDTVLLQNGKVIVQKDGSQFEVEPGRSLMMNDGTKVFGDGTLVNRDGSKAQLVEGQIITIDGVVKRR